MSTAPTVYHSIDSELSARERADRVLAACFEGDIDGAKSLLEPGHDADSLLAQGVVIYWLARIGTKAGYEGAKDLLSKASRLFGELGDLDRSALADVWLGLCYWRLGQPAEAYVIFDRTNRALDPRVRFVALLNRSVIQTEAGEWAVGLRTLEEARCYFDAEQSPSRRGKFFQQRGLCYKLAYEETGDQEYLDKALIEYEAASDHYERAGNRRFEAAILNNVANLYRLAGQIQRARNSIDRAITLYESIADRSHLAHAKDTKALILMSAGEYARAKKYADQSIALLRNQDPAWVTIPLVTRARVHHKLGLYAAAQADFQEAITIAESAGDSKRAAAIYLDQADTLAGYLSIQALAHIFARIAELNPTRELRVAHRILEFASSPELRSLTDLKEAERKQEHEVILRALEAQKGSVTRAARVLGKTHGGLTHIIKTRHPDLATHCRPIVRRRKRLLKS